ncbi:hypothetical protein GPD45_003830, partial [Salmonella enterica]|nr:hypothetical protein [Salmonella enterica]
MFFCISVQTMECRVIKKPGSHFTRRKFFEKHFFKMEYRSILLLWLFQDDVVFIRNILKD